MNLIIKSQIKYSGYFIFWYLSSKTAFGLLNIVKYLMQLFIFFLRFNKRNL